MDKTTTSSTKPTGGPGYVLLLAGIGALGGLLFGYDTAVIAGAVGFLEQHFRLSAGLTGWAASSVLVGCMAGALAGGPLSDRFGRRRMLIANALLFALSGILTAIAPSLDAYVIARLIGGVAIGAVSVISPLYIAEVAPKRMRGQLVSLYQFAIVTGILVVFFVNLLIQRHGDQAWNVDYGWRWMFGSLTFPALLLVALSMSIPESPRWLMSNGRRDDARTILERVGGVEEAEESMAEMDAAMAQETGRLSEIFTPAYRRPLLIGIGLAVFCQFSGINAIMYYAPEIFKSSGAGLDSAFLQTVLIGVVNLLFTLVAVRLIDRAGRRPLLLAGAAVQVVALALVGVAFARGWSGLPLLAPILVFIAAFASGMGPVPWVVISEIFPLRTRGVAMAVATVVLWASDFVVAQTFPLLKAGIGPASTFWIYAGCSFASLVFVAMRVVETRGRSLEEIEASWRPGSNSAQNTN